MSADTLCENVTAVDQNGDNAATTTGNCAAGGNLSTSAGSDVDSTGASLAARLDFPIQGSVVIP